MAAAPQLNFTHYSNQSKEPSNESKIKVSSDEKLVFRSGVRILFLFVLTDAILLKLDLQKRTNDLDNPPNQKLFV